MLLKTAIVGAAGSLLFNYRKQKIYSADSKAGFESKSAIALIYPSPGYNVTGAVSFFQQNPEAPTLVTARVKNLPVNGVYGFHIHQYGDLSSGCESVGSHFDSEDNINNKSASQNSPLGDLGNFKADDNGYGNYTHKNNRITLNGEDSILGRSVLIHRKEQNIKQGAQLETKTTDPNSTRIAVGIIALTQELKNLPARF